MRTPSTCTSDTSANINTVLEHKPEYTRVTTHTRRGNCLSLWTASAATSSSPNRRSGRYVPLEQICLSPQCGFSSTVEGNTLTNDEEVAKLRLVVETAQDVWG